MNTYLHAPAVSCDKIHKVKRDGYKSLPPNLAPEIQRYT